MRRINSECQSKLNDAQYGWSPHPSQKHKKLKCQVISRVEKKKDFCVHLNNEIICLPSSPNISRHLSSDTGFLRIITYTTKSVKLFRWILTETLAQAKTKTGMDDGRLMAQEVNGKNVSRLRISKNWCDSDLKKMFVSWAAIRCSAGSARKMSHFVCYCLLTWSYNNIFHANDSVELSITNEKIGLGKHRVK